MTDPVQRSLDLARLYHGETTYDFVGSFRRWAIISGVVIAVGLVSLVCQGLNLGIDFEGGMVWEVPAGRRVRRRRPATRRGPGVEEVTVQTLTAEGEDPAPGGGAPRSTSTEAKRGQRRLAELTGSDVDDVSLNSVGPSWGERSAEKALRALVLFLVVLTLYISFRFELRMAVPTIVALIHDILVTIGVYSLPGSR